MGSLAIWPGRLSAGTCGRDPSHTARPHAALCSSPTRLQSFVFALAQNILEFWLKYIRLPCTRPLIPAGEPALAGTLCVPACPSSADSHCVSPETAALAEQSQIFRVPGLSKTVQKVALLKWTDPEIPWVTSFAWRNIGRTWDPLATAALTSGLLPWCWVLLGSSENMMQLF